MSPNKDETRRCLPGPGSVHYILDFPVNFNRMAKIHTREIYGPLADKISLFFNIFILHTDVNYYTLLHLIYIYRVSRNSPDKRRLEIVDIKICLLSQICPSKMLEVKEIQGVESEN